MKKVFALLLACLMLLPLTACSDSDSPTQRTNGSQPSESGTDTLTDFEVILDWFPNAIHAFLYTAKEKGYFEQVGLNVILTPPAGFSDPLTFPAAGRAEVGLYYMDDVIVGYADQGMGIEIIGAVTQQSLDVMIALGGSGLTTPADFGGKTIGYSGSPVLEAKVRQICRDAGLQANDYTLLDIGFDIMTAQTTGSVDITAGGMINAEVVELRHAGYDVMVWEWADFGIPRVYNTVLVANKTAYEADRATYEAFLAACQKGFADVAADPEAAITLIMQQEDAENYALTREVEEQSLSYLLQVEAESGVPFLSMAPEVWATSNQWLYDNGLVSRTVDCTEFVKFDWDQ